jgi:hypothetical protein
VVGPFALPDRKGNLAVADIAQATETTSTEGAQAAESTGPETDSSFDFDAAFGDAPGVKAAPTPSAESGQSQAEQSSQPVAGESKPDDDGEQDDEPAAAAVGEQPKLSRRQQAEQERQRELAEVRQRADAAEARTADLERQLGGQQSAQDEIQSEIAAGLGDQTEFERLSALPSSALTYEEQENLDVWKEARAKFVPFVDLARRSILVDMAQRTDAIMAEIGVDRAAVSRQPDVPDLIRLAVNHVTTALKSAHTTALSAANDQIEQLRGELHEARTKAAGSTRPLETGGLSAPAVRSNGAARFDPSKTADELFRSAF